jgi:hypothetical protein
VAQVFGRGDVSGHVRQGGDGTPEATGELRCECCGGLFYSAAAEQLVDRDDRCDSCGGPLDHAPIRPLKIEIIGVASMLTVGSRN